MMPLSHAINSEIAKATGISRLAGFHLGNIAIHICSVILVYFLFCLLLGRWGRAATGEMQDLHYSHQAFAAALIFAIHPIAGAAVNYIAARDLLLMVFFFLASILVYFRMRAQGDTVWGWFMSLLLLILAILSKQVAIMGFALIFLFEWVLVESKLWNWKLWGRTLLFAAPTAAYFLLRSLWLVGQHTAGLRTTNGFTYPLTMLDAHLFYYFRNFVWPFEMRALAKVNMLESILEPSALAGLLFIISTLVIAWIFRKRQPVITFAVPAYWLLFSLTSSIFPFGYVVTDYRQYLPLVFLSLTVTLLVFSSGRKRFSLIFLSGLVLYFSLSSYVINKNWKTEESFWGQSVKYGAVALAHNNYGLSIAGKDPDLAEYHYLEALHQSPYHIYANINLGLLYIKQGKNDEGLKILYKITRLNPDWALAHYWLAYGLKSVDRTEEALRETQLAADLDPRSLEYQYEAARALQNDGQYAEAVPYLERIIDLNPEYKLAEFMLGFIRQKSGQSQQAIELYNRFLQRNPRHIQGHFNLAYELMEQGDCRAAVDHFKTVLELKPEYREVHSYLSRCYRSLGKNDLAMEHASLYQSKQ